MKKGFTLIELLVAMSVFVVIGVFVTSTLSNVLTTRGKVEVTKAVRQEADYAVAVIERHLRSAQSVVCSETDVSYVDLDGTSSSFSCTGVGGDDSYIASGSARLTTSEVAITSCQFQCPTASQVTFSFSFSQKKITASPQESSSLSVSSQVTLRNQ